MFSVMFLSAYICECIEERSQYDWEYMRNLYYSKDKYQYKKPWYARVAYFCSRCSMLLVTLISVALFWICYFGMRDDKAEISVGLIVVLGVFQTILIGIQVFMVVVFIIVDYIAIHILG
jgi:hypothetical protein